MYPNIGGDEIVSQNECPVVLGVKIVGENTVGASENKIGTKNVCPMSSVIGGEIKRTHHSSVIA